MNWKNLLFLPLAALALGIPLRAPRLRPPLPEGKGESCDHAFALQSYLNAYAYSREMPLVASKLLRNATLHLAPCRGRHPALEQRIRDLSLTLAP